jgi:hypothetical protein
MFYVFIYQIGEHDDDGHIFEVETGDFAPVNFIYKAFVSDGKTGHLERYVICIQTFI